MTARDCILVTGGCGYVGSHFARAAHAAGSKVVVLDDSRRAHAELPAAIEIVRGDIAGPHARAAAVARARDHGGRALRRQDPGRRVGAEAALYFDGNLVKSARAARRVARRARSARSCSRRRRRVYGMPDEVPIPETARRAADQPVRRDQARDRARARRLRRRARRCAGRRCATSTPPARTPTARCARATSPRPTCCRS